MMVWLYILFGTITFSGLSLPQAGAVFYAIAVPKSISSRRLWLTVRISFGLIDFDIP
jgi:hypothetical protein